MRKLITLTIICLMATAVRTEAQDLLEIKRVSLEELVNFIRKEINPHTYFVKDEQEQSTYTVSAPRAGFLEAAKTELGNKGYMVSSYDGAIFILHSKSMYAGLPTGYFDKGSLLSSNDDGLQKFLADQNTIVTFQNKVYEIGERTAKRSGKVYVSGHVNDVASGEPIPGVSVYNQESGVYTVTDGSGFYRVLLPVGENKLSYSGYSLEDMQLSLQVYDEGGLDVVMKEKVTALNGAVVSADMVSHHRDASMGLEKIRINVVTKIPSAFGEADILKAVLTLPGVKAVGEASSGFNVRGGATDQNLILFNDGTIYNPSHMFGIFSAFNPDVISEVELYKSSIPVEFGGRISSVLDVRGREGNSNKITGSVGIGLLTSKVHLEGPLVKGKTSFILGGRTTYSNWILKMLPKNSNFSGGAANFHDANASVSHKINDKNSIHAYAYWSMDNFKFQNDTTFRYMNINASVKWRSNFSSQHNMVAVAGYDDYNAGFDNAFRNNIRSSYSIKTGIRQAYAKATFHSSINEFHKLTYGANATYYFVNPGERNPLHTENTFVQPLKLDLEKGLEPALFISDTWTLNEKITLDGGLRLSGFYSGNDRKFYGMPEIRLSGKYSIKDNLSLKAGINSMNQYIHLISNTTAISPMDTWRLTNAKIKPQTGWQAAGGLYWTIAGGLVDISVEGYYKRMYNTLDYKSGATIIMNPNLADDLVPTFGKAYGAELMVKKTTGKFTGWMSYTYSRSFLKEMLDRGVEAINNGNWYNAPHDKPHDVKFVGNYKVTHRLSFSANLDYSTGRPVTVPIGWYYYGGGQRLAYSDRNTYRIPDYFRLDLAMNIEPSHYLKQLTHMSFTFGVYNVTGRKNAYSVFFDEYLKGHILSVFACPIPYINLNLKF